MVWPGLSSLCPHQAFFALAIVEVRYLAIFSFSLTKFTKEPREDLTPNPIGPVNKHKIWSAFCQSLV